MGDVGERQEAEGGCRLTRVVLEVQGEYHLDGEDGLAVSRDG